MKRRRKSRARPPDLASMAEGFRGPEKLWISYGVVSSDNNTVVEFNQADGQVYLFVTLEPSKTPIRARLLNQVAGDQEGDYYPWVKGEEVLVAIPEGNERAGAVVLGRLNNALDVFPMGTIAGQDPKSNAFGFRRRRAPYVEEFVGPTLWRQVGTGAFISIDEVGVLTLRDAEGSALQLSPDVVGFQGPSDPTTPPKFLMQLGLSIERYVLQVNDALLSIGGSGAAQNPGSSFMALPGELVVSFGTNTPAEHVATVEFVLAAIQTALAPVVGGPAGVTALGLAVAAGGVPMGALAAALATGLPIAATVVKPPVVGGVQAAPTLGAVNFKTG